MISGSIFLGFVFTNAYLAYNYFWKEAFLDHATLKKNLANNLISYKTESNSLRSSIQEDQMVLAKHQLSKFPIENPVSIVDIAVKTAKECLQHLNVPYAKCHCVNHLQQRIVGIVT